VETLSLMSLVACLPASCVDHLQVHNEGGSKRVVVTKNLPGERWLQILTAAGCRVEVRPAVNDVMMLTLAAFSFSR
jgi:hypothetical protein